MTTKCNPRFRIINNSSKYAISHVQFCTRRTTAINFTGANIILANIRLFIFLFFSFSFCRSGIQFTTIRVRVGLFFKYILLWSIKFMVFHGKLRMKFGAVQIFIHNSVQILNCGLQEFYCLFFCICLENCRLHQKWSLAWSGLACNITSLSVSNVL